MKMIILSLLFLLFSNLHSQVSPDDTPIADNISVSKYLDYTKDLSNLYYGKSHTPFLRGLMVGSYTPYLLPSGITITPDNNSTIPRLTDYYSEGKLIYNGVVYPKETMLLDLYRNDLIVFSPGNFNIIIDPEKVEMAELQGYHIFYLKPNNFKDCPSKGYYLLLDDNDYCSLIKKDTYNFVKQTTPEATLIRNIKYYILKDEVYHQVSGKSSVLKVFDDKRKELDNFIKENNLEFNSTMKEYSMKLIVKQYEKLKRQ